MGDVTERIVKLAGPVADEQGVWIVDVEMAGSARKPTVRVFIDKEGGVTLNDCERFSRAMSALLDVEDIIPFSYVLEVSSPGLDRPLKDIRDFERSVGKLARVVTRESIANQTFFVGRIMAVKENTVMLMVNNKEEVYIPIDRISKARLEIEF
jgi:ribosome maturation factor RimP